MNAETSVMNWKAFTLNLNSAQTLSLNWPTHTNITQHSPTLNNRYTHTHVYACNVLPCASLVTLQPHMSTHLTASKHSTRTSFFASNLSRLRPECCNLDSCHLLKVKLSCFGFWFKELSRWSSVCRGGTVRKCALPHYIIL